MVVVTMDYKLLTLIIIAAAFCEGVTSLAFTTPSTTYKYDYDYKYDYNYDYNYGYDYKQPAGPAEGGIKLRFTQHAFDYVSSVSMVLLAKELQGLTLPHIVQKVGPIHVNITNINITENPPPKIAIKPLPGVGLRCTISEMAPHLEADYKSKMSLGFFSIKKKGQMFVRSAQVTFNIDIRIGRDNTSRPTVEVLDCSGVGLASARFEGGWSDGLNAASTMFGKEIKSLLFAQICWRFKQDIGQNLTALIQSAPVSYVVEKVFELDFGLVQFPYFSNAAMETAHTGAVFLLDKDGKRKIPPFSPPSLPPIESHNKTMLYIYISSYMLNTAGYAAYHSGKLAGNVTKNLIPPPYGNYLKTSCPGQTCVGSIFPELGARHPNTDVTLEIFAKAPPQVEFRNKTIMVNASVDVDVHVANDGRLLTITANLTARAQVAVKGNKIFFNFTDITPKTTISNSVIPELNGSGYLLNSLARMATQQFLKPKLAEMGQKGIEIPTHKDILITNPEIIFEDSLPDVLVIAGDVRYLGPMPTQAPAA